MFSIIIPCYNVEEYISSTINSVLEQTYNNWELILVNDGSTDNTIKILERYNKKYERITVIEQDNNGVSSARNIGLEMAKGEYIYFLDGDDIIESNLFTQAKKAFEKNKEIDIFSFGFNIVNNEKEVMESYSFEKYNADLFSSNEFMKLYLNKKIRQHICSFIIKKKILIDNQISFSENISYGEDQEFQIKSIHHSNIIFYKSFPFFNYLNRSDSAVNKKITVRRLDLIKVMFDLQDYLLNNNINKNIISDFNNYLSMVYLFLFREGVKKDAGSKYFKELSFYSDILKEASIKFTKYGLINYLLSKLYLLKPKLLIIIFKVVYRK